MSFPSYIFSTKSWKNRPKKWIHDFMIVTSESTWLDLILGHRDLQTALVVTELMMGDMLGVLKNITKHLLIHLLKQIGLIRNTTHIAGFTAGQGTTKQNSISLYLTFSSMKYLDDKPGLCEFMYHYHVNAKWQFFYIFLLQEVISLQSSYRHRYSLCLESSS